MVVTTTKSGGRTLYWFDDSGERGPVDRAIEVVCRETGGQVVHELDAPWCDILTVAVDGHEIPFVFDWADGSFFWSRDKDADATLNSIAGILERAAARPADGR